MVAALHSPFPSLCVLTLTPAGLKFGTTGEEWSPTEKGDTRVDSSDGWDTGRSGRRTGVLVWGGISEVSVTLPIRASGSSSVGGA